MKPFSFHSKLFAGLVLTLAFACASAALWQKNKNSSLPPATTGEISGHVSDHHGTPLAGAQVTVTGADSNHSSKTTSDASGTFTVSDLAPGSYHLTISSKNFVTASAKATVKPGKVARLHVRLKLAAGEDSAKPS